MPVHLDQSLSIISEQILSGRFYRYCLSGLTVGRLHLTTGHHSNMMSFCSLDQCPLCYLASSSCFFTPNFSFSNPPPSPMHPHPPPPLTSDSTNRATRRRVLKSRGIRSMLLTPQVQPWLWWNKHVGYIWAPWPSSSLSLPCDFCLSINTVCDLACPLLLYLPPVVSLPY